MLDMRSKVLRFAALWLTLGALTVANHAQSQGSWRTLTAIPAGRHGTVAATTGGHVYIAAGSLRPGSGQVTDQLIAFSLP